ncbi:MAG: 23S rRNA (adenine(2503)-C(2))-methyltransferase RlmN [Chloroflexota bacterium]|nr:23S rRNA (adenine(2503)-C(2))-methyltransferase RlmN [Chloroflexota bacterium]
MDSGTAPAADARLAELLAEWGEPGFRLRQIRQWKYRKLVDGYSQMTDLPASLRNRLESEAPFRASEVIRAATAADGQTVKVLLALQDGQQVESVLMRQRGPHETAERNTVCVSSQAGCKMRCSFCATGHGGWQRDLAPAEIVDQVLHFGRLLETEGRRVTHLVFMGMGEPLDNYDNVLAAVHLLNDPTLFGLGARHITISTCGLIPQIHRLAGESVQVNLAVSLGATADDRRNELIPINRRFPIRQLLDACEAYAGSTRRRVSYEYVLIAGVNDSPAEAVRLAALLKGRLAHVNLIPLNPVTGDPYARPDEPAVRRFEEVLRHARVPATVRYSRGVDIAAGCGQLRANATSTDARSCTTVG